jgi:hypothetical protein
MQHPDFNLVAFKVTEGNETSLVHKHMCIGNGSKSNLVPRCSFRWLHKPLETAEPNYFSRVQTRGFVYTLRMNILTCAQLKLDDSAEFQIVPKKYNQISILHVLYSINLSF